MAMRWWGALGMVLALVTCREVTDPVVMRDQASVPLSASLVPVEEVSYTWISGVDEARGVWINNLGQILHDVEHSGSACGAWLYSNGLWLAPPFPAYGGDHCSVPIDLNNAGQVLAVDGRFPELSEHPYYVDEQGVTSFPALPESAVPMAFNDRGQIIGQWFPIGPTPHGFVLEGGVIRDLGPVGGGSAFGIAELNNAGVAVGWATNGALVWDTDGAPSVVPGYVGAVDVNDLGQMLLSGSGGETLVMGPEGAVVEVPLLHGQRLNNLGQVLGLVPSDEPTSQGGTFVWQRAVWQAGGGISLLPNVDGDSPGVGPTVCYSRPDSYHDLNDLGQVVAVCEPGSLNGLLLYSTLRPATPREEADVLTRMVRALVAAGDLPRAEGGSLLWTIDNIKKQLDQGKCRTGKQGFKTFINKVRSYVGDGLLTAEDAAPLLSGARDALDALPC